MTEQLLGGSGAGAARLSAAELARRLDRFLAFAEDLINAVPDPYTEHRPAGQDAAIRDLAYRIFRLGLAFADGMDRGEVPAAWLSEEAPAGLRDAGAIARYGALVRGRLGGWLEGAGPSEYARVVDTPEGPSTGHALLERLTALVAQRLCELSAAVADLGIAVAPVPPDELEGLPVRRSLG